MVDLKKFPFPPGYNNKQTLPDFIDNVITFYSEQTSFNTEVERCLVAIKDFTITREREHRQREKELNSIIENLEYRLKAIENWTTQDAGYPQKLTKYH